MVGHLGKTEMEERSFLLGQRDSYFPSGVPHDTNLTAKVSEPADSKSVSPFLFPVALFE